MPKRKPRVLSLFAGCGGLDLGFIKEGYEVVWANDFYEDAVNTYKKNIGNHISNEDIRKVKDEDLPNNIDIVLGGFPCQGFSVANNKRSMKDERNFLYMEMLRIVKKTKPKFFVGENVKGLLSMNGGKVIQMIIDDFKKIGYDVDTKVLRASDFGVPQHRERVFILGNRIGKKNVFPAPTHKQPNGSKISKDKKHIAVRDAIGHLSKIWISEKPFVCKGKKLHNHIASTNVHDKFWARKHPVKQEDVCDYLRKWRTKAGISVKKIDELFGYRHTAGHWFRKDNNSGSIPKPEDWWRLKKLLKFDDKFDKKVTELELRDISFEQSLRISNWDTPSDTITATGPEIHPNKKRRLSVRECAILQSFPDDFVFEGSLNSMYRQIGNAVPPLLARQVAKEVKKAILRIL